VRTTARRLPFFALITVTIAAAGSSLFRPSQALTGGGSITTLGVPLTENFDGRGEGLPIS
jgi:hypothetical protein